MKRVFLSKEAPAPIGPYSQAIAVNGFLFCSGQIPLDAKTGEIVGETVEQQTEQVMKNIGFVLKSADRGFGDVIKSTIFLADMADFNKVNEVYAKYFNKEAPTRSTVAVKTLPKNVLVEIEVLAVKN